MNSFAKAVDKEELSTLARIEKRSLANDVEVAASFGRHGLARHPIV